MPKKARPAHQGSSSLPALPKQRTRRQIASTSFTNATEANTFASQKKKDGWYVTKRTVVKVSAEPPKRKPKAKAL